MGLVFSLFDSKNKITSTLIFQAQLGKVEVLFPLWSSIWYNYTLLHTTIKTPTITNTVLHVNKQNKAK